MASAVVVSAIDMRVTASSNSPLLNDRIALSQRMSGWSQILMVG